MTYEDLQGKDSTFENTPGTEQVIYFAPISDFRYVASPKEFVNVDDYGDATLIEQKNNVNQSTYSQFKMKFITF